MPYFSSASNELVFPLGGTGRVLALTGGGPWLVTDPTQVQILRESSQTDEYGPVEYNASPAFDRTRESVLGFGFSL